MPQVSVIIPTFNRASFTREAIDSVLAQKFTDFEIIVVDDGSDDDTEAILRASHLPIQIIRQPNMGVSAARNAGIQAAKGTYLAFLDSDDLWKKDKLWHQIHFFQDHPTAKICYTGEEWIRNGRHVNQTKNHAKYDGWIFEHLLPRCIISASSIMFHREILAAVGLFDTDLEICEDYDLWLRIGAKFPIYLLPEKHIIKRDGHPDQLSHKYWGMDRWRVQALDKLLKTCELTPGQRSLTIAELRRKYQILIQGFEKHGKTTAAAKYRQLAETYSGE
ncbi:glycosyltransferase [bacterium]|nr:glycosyltransferase [bacterium]